LADHPSCSSGPPVTLDWEYNPRSVKLSIDEYEKVRGNRRGTFEMVLPKMVRQDMLKYEWNVTQYEIACAVRSIVRVKTQRRTTVNNLGKASKMEEMFEKCYRTAKRTLLIQKKTSEQVRELNDKYDQVEQMRRRSMAAEYMASSSIQMNHRHHHHHQEQIHISSSIINDNISIAIPPPIVATKG